MLQYFKPYELNYSGAVCHNLVSSTLATQNVVAPHVLHAGSHPHLSEAQDWLLLTN